MDIILCCVIADGPIQTPVLMSPTPQQPVAVTTPTPNAAIQRQTKLADAGSNGQLTASHSLSPLPAGHRHPVPVGSIRRSPYSFRETPTLMSPNSVILDREPPVLAPKLRHQERASERRHNDSKNVASKDNYAYRYHYDDEKDVYNIPRRDQLPVTKTPYSDSKTAACKDDSDSDDDDDEDVYNYPNQKFSHGPYQQDDETYDTPPRLTRQPVDDSYDDTYDLPPKSHGNKDRNDEIYDIPPIVSTNTANNCPSPVNHGKALRHSYVNAPSSAMVDATGCDVSSKLKPVHRFLSDSTEDDDDIVVSSRTRSFKCSNSRYVLHSTCNILKKFCKFSYNL